MQEIKIRWASFSASFLLSKALHDSAVSPVKSFSCPNLFLPWIWHPYLVTWRTVSFLFSSDTIQHHFHSEGVTHHHEGAYLLQSSPYPPPTSVGKPTNEGRKLLTVCKTEDFANIPISRKYLYTVDCNLPSLLWKHLFPTALQSSWHSKIPSCRMVVNTKQVWRKFSYKLTTGLTGL